jgi:Ca-activated chloride channel family protein
MKKITLGIFIVILLTIQGLPQDSQPQVPEDLRPTASLSVNVDLVELHVTVTDLQGRPFGGLHQENFRVTENNIDQPISVFKHEDIPVSLGLVLDNSRSIEPRKARLDAAALSFVQKSNSEDETFIVHFDGEARLTQEFTQDHAVLDARLRAATPFGQTAIYDGIMLGLDTMSKAQYTKKALLLVTDGIDNSSKASFDELLDRVKRERVMVFTIGLLSQSGGIQAEESLIRIADSSGGRAYFPQTPEEASALMELIARDLREQYTLAYLPTNRLRNGTWRSVRVEVTPPKGFLGKLTTNYRHGYYAPDR